MSKKKKMTQEEFIKYCYTKAAGNLLTRLYKMTRELVLPEAIKIMNDEFDSFNVI